MNKNTLIKMAMIVVLSTASMWAGFKLSQLLDRESGAVPIIEGTILNPPRQISKFELMDQRRHEFGPDQLAGKWSLIFIGYTNCPDVCPNTLSVLKQAYIDMTVLKMELPQVVFVSIDPQRDDAEILGDYVYYFDPSFVAVTGKKAELDNLSKQLSSVYLKAAGASGDIKKDDYLFDHSASVLVINPKAQLQAVFTAPHNKLGIVDGMQKIMAFYNKR
ncbi:MAG: SCO family protein [Gammaproteobacteria bacterium]|nr:SCO family protein [Gammaproteobacteria bacterium]